MEWEKWKQKLHGTLQGGLERLKRPAVFFRVLAGMLILVAAFSFTGTWLTVRASCSVNLFGNTLTLLKENSELLSVQGSGFLTFSEIDTIKLLETEIGEFEIFEVPVYDFLTKPKKDTEVFDKVLAILSPENIALLESSELKSLVEKLFPNNSRYVLDFFYATAQVADSARGLIQSADKVLQNSVDALNQVDRAFEKVNMVKQVVNIFFFMFFLLLVAAFVLLCVPKSRGKLSGVFCCVGGGLALALVIGTWVGNMLVENVAQQGALLVNTAIADGVQTTMANLLGSSGRLVSLLVGSHPPDILHLQASVQAGAGVWVWLICCMGAAAILFLLPKLERKILSLQIKEIPALDRGETGALQTGQVSASHGANGPVAEGEKANAAQTKENK